MEHKTDKAKRPDEGLTGPELTEVRTWERAVAKDEANPSPPGASASSLEAEIACLEAEIKIKQAQITALQHPYQPFPKMVKGRTFNSQAEIDAAGPYFADDRS